MHDSHKIVAPIKRRLVRLSVFLGILFFCFLLMVTAIFYAKRVWILEQVQSYVNEVQSGELKIEKMELVLFKHLPNVTIRLVGINYYEKRDSLRKEGEFPIASAKELFIAFEFWALISGDILKVTNVSLEGGALNLVKYESGKLNLENALMTPRQENLKSTTDPPVQYLKKNTPNDTIKRGGNKRGLDQSTGQRSFEFDIKSIGLRNIGLTYIDIKGKQKLAVNFKELEGNFNFRESDLDCDLITAFLVEESSDFPDASKLGIVDLNVILNYSDTSKIVNLVEGDLLLEDMKTGLSGRYELKGNRRIDLSFDASSNNLEILSKFIQHDVLKRSEALVKKARINLKGKLYGETVSRMPNFDITFGVDNLSIQLPKEAGTFEDIGFEGEFQSGDSPDFSQATLSLKNLKGTIPSGKIEGDFMCTNFVDPYLKYDFHLGTILNAYDDIFQFSSISDLEGKLNVTAVFEGPLKLGEDEHRTDSLSAWTVTAANVGFIYTPTNKKISNLGGIFSEINNEVSISNFGFNYDSSDLNVSGTIANLYHFLFNKRKDLHASLIINSDQIFTNDLILKSSNPAMINDRISELNLGIKILGESDTTASLFPKLNFNVDQLSFDLDRLPGVHSLKASGSFYKLGSNFKLDLKDFKAEMPYGSVSILGDLLIEKENKLQVNASVKMFDFPWTYIEDLIKELQGKTLIGSKSLSPSEMKIWNADLDISTTMGLIPFSMPTCNIRKSDILIHNPDSMYFDLRGLDVDLENLTFLHANGSQRIIGIDSVDCNVGVSSIAIPGLKKSAMKLQVEGKNDLLNSRFSMLSEFRTNEEGSLILDMRDDTPDYTIKYTMHDVPVEAIVGAFYSKKLIEGQLDATIDLKGKGLTWSDTKKTAAGSVSISGDSLVLLGIDIDDVLKKYEHSQNFRLVDIGAVMLAGPMGAVVTKGSDFGKLAIVGLNSNKSTTIPKLLARWTIHDGILETQDVAFSTPLNRLAFKGQLDFVNNTIPGYTAYVLDKSGCSLMEQRIYGNIGDIKIEKIKIAKALFGSVINFVNAVVGKDCKPVYAGAIKHPGS